jgi:hypothetical protein
MLNNNFYENKKKIYFYFKRVPSYDFFFARPRKNFKIQNSLKRHEI